jgi:hypothetical protein
MLPSEELRQTISKKYNIDLEQYKWNEEFQQSIFEIELDKDLEDHASTLEEIYQNGYNIGHCGLTSRYLAKKFDTATLYYGKATLLIGTKNSPNGEHAWLTINNFVIDTTLMICIPLEQAKKLGYTSEKEIAHDSARMLSEYDLFDHEYKENQKLTHKKKN